METASADGWPWLRRTYTLTTTAGTSSYSFTTLGALATPSTGVGKILGAKVLVSSTYQSLRLLSPEDAVEIYPSTTNNRPEAWFVEGQTFYLYPTPDAAYTIPIRLVITETDLVGTTSTPILPVVFHGAIVEAATLLMYETTQDGQRVQQQEAKVASWIARMARNGREYPSAPKIRVREWMT